MKFHPALVAVLLASTAGACIEVDDPADTSEELTIAGEGAGSIDVVGPFRPFKSARSTRGSASLQDGEGTLSDTDLITAPDAGPFSADASASVARGEITAAGVTTHDSSLDGRVLTMDSHCDANANVYDPEVESGFASCGNDYSVQFELLRPAKVTFDGSVSSFRAGHGGGWGEIWLRDEKENAILGIASDNDSLYETLILNPGFYRLTATGGGSASAFYDTQFSAATVDVRIVLTARNR
jgi:hypothetical protein